MANFPDVGGKHLLDKTLDEFLDKAGKSPLVKIRLKVEFYRNPEIINKITSQPNFNHKQVLKQSFMEGLGAAIVTLGLSLAVQFYQYKTKGGNIKIVDTLVLSGAVGVSVFAGTYGARGISHLLTETQLGNDLCSKFEVFSGDFSHSEKFISSFGGAAITALVFNSLMLASSKIDGRQFKMNLESTGISLGVGAIAYSGTYYLVGTLATTATTNVSIGTLSGAAAHNATLAWLGGGAKAVGGRGMAAGAKVLVSIKLFAALVAIYAFRKYIQYLDEQEQIRLLEGKIKIALDMKILEKNILP